MSSLAISFDGSKCLSGTLRQSNYFDLTDGHLIKSFRNNSDMTIESISFSPLQETDFDSNYKTSSLPSKSFSISPNPFSSRLSLSLPTSGAIYSLTGHLIMKLDKGKHELYTSKWREGVYIVKAGKETKRIVKIN
ncbi:MAG: T9SS type A sorting domain-containing protein [Candidatus Coatesbacteria bacterium]|nr:T9SS type A sorting domain-containing protein [Candidatus Coatesbacteria bacterium]